MRLILKNIINMAADQRISDKHFRAAMLKLADRAQYHEGTDELMKRFAQEAIYATEYDNCVK